MNNQNKNPEQLAYINHLDSLTPNNRAKEMENLMLLLHRNGWLEFDNLEVELDTVGAEANHDNN